MSLRLLKIPEAAELLGVSPRTMRRWITSGAMPAFRDGGIVRVREIDLHRFTAERMALPLASGGEPSGTTLKPGERLWD